MSKRIVILIFICFVMFVSLNSHAADTGWTEISQYHPWDVGVYIKLENGKHDVGPSCGSSSWMLLPNTQKNYKEYNAALLSAFIARKTVMLHSATCSGQYSVIKGLQIKH